MPFHGFSIALAYAWTMHFDDFSVFFSGLGLCLGHAVRWFALVFPWLWLLLFHGSGFSFDVFFMFFFGFGLCLGHCSALHFLACCLVFGGSGLTISMFFFGVGGPCFVFFDVCFVFGGSSLALGADYLRGAD